jgi:tripartite-type tricarboxylate transporter receptor subunit TctC
VTLQRRELLTLAACLPLLPSQSWSADAWPSHPIRLVVPFTAGGGTDLIARTLAQGLSDDLHQQVIIDNKGGGGTVIGSDYVAKSAPDGYTVLLTTSALPINATLVKTLPYDTQKDFTEVGLICKGPNVVVCRADSRLKTIQDVIDAARADPGKLSYGSSGNGTAVHLAMELFKNLAKVDIQHIPYRGAGPAFTDLLGGQTDLVCGTAGGVGKFVESGKMRAIAVTSPQRSSAFKDVPTIAETMPGYEAEVWYALFAPGRTPAPIVARINQSLRRAAEAPETRSRVENEGLLIAVGTPDEMTRFMRSEELRWRKVIVDGHIAID